MNARGMHDKVKQGPLPGEKLSKSLSKTQRSDKERVSRQVKTSSNTNMKHQCMGQVLKRGKQGTTVQEMHAGEPQSVSKEGRTLFNQAACKTTSAMSHQVAVSSS